MRKLIVAVMTFFTIMVLIGCSNNKEADVKEELNTHDSYTLEEIKSAKFPDGYANTVISNDLIDYRVNAKYPTSFTFDNLMIEFDEIRLDTLKFESSGPEDGMIYTICSAETYMGDRAEILFINDPVTCEFVAGSYTTSNYKNYSHYLFFY